MASSSSSHDTINLQTLLTSSPSSPDDNKNIHSSSAASTSKSCSTSSQNYSTSTSSAKSTKESIQTLFRKPIGTFTSKNKRILLKKKSQSYQDLHLPSVRRRYSNVQSKVKVYIDSLRASNSNGKRAPLLRHQSMPDTYQNLLKEEAMTPETVKRKLHSVQADNANMSNMIDILQHDLETVKIEKYMLVKKVEEMRTVKDESSKAVTVASREFPFKVVSNTGTQTCDLDEAARNYEMSATASIHSSFDEILVNYRALTDDAQVNHQRELGIFKKKKSFFKRKVKEIFSCVS
jgi:hypothetical protein